MKELLNSDELGDLLTAVSEGQAPSAPARSGSVPREAEPYDFRQPGRLSRDQQRTAHGVHTAAATELSAVLGGLLRASIDVNLVSLDAVTYESFESALPVPACLQVFRARRVDGGEGAEGDGLWRAALVLDIPLAFGIIERLLGGRGQAVEQPRPLTAIERAVLAPALRAVLGCLATAWREYAQVEYEPEDIETGSGASRVLGPQEMVVHMVFALGSEMCVGDVHLCLPVALIDRLVPRNATHAPAPDSAQAGTLDALRRAVGGAPVRVAAELGRTHISLQDLLSLQPGHVVRLDKSVGEPLDITVERIPHLAGRPGVLGSKLGMQVTALAPQTRKGPPRP